MTYNESDYIYPDSSPDYFDEDFYDNLHELDPNDTIVMYLDEGGTMVITVKEFLEQVEEHDKQVDEEIYKEDNSDSPGKESFIKKIKFW